MLASPIITESVPLRRRLLFGAALAGGAATWIAAAVTALRLL